MNHEQRLLQLVLGTALVVSLTACAGLPVSQTVQRGSTIVVPLANYLATNPMIGYGGSQISDPQRGEMQFFLVDPAVTASPPNLDDTSISFPIRPRGSWAAASAPADSSFRTGAPLPSGGSIPPVQVVSILDIPQNAPPGHRVLWVRHLKPDGTTETPKKIGDIWILPSSVSFSENGTSYTVDGTSTPFKGFGQTLTTQELQSAVPDPTAVIKLPTSVYAVTFTAWIGNSTAGYADVVDAVSSSFSGLRSQPLVKVTQPYLPGYPMIYKVEIAATDPAGFDEIDLVFRLNGSTPIDPATDVYVEFTHAWDQDGNTILDQNGAPLYDNKFLTDPSLNITPSVR